MKTKKKILGIAILSLFVAGAFTVNSQTKPSNKVAKETVKTTAAVSDIKKNNSEKGILVLSRATKAPVEINNSQATSGGATQTSATIVSTQASTTKAVAQPPVAKKVATTKNTSKQTTTKSSASKVASTSSVNTVSSGSSSSTAVKTTSSTTLGSDADLLSRLVSAEAAGESYEGKLAVATVILNRVSNPNYPKSISGVILDKSWGYQFTPVADGRINLAATSDSIKAAQAVLNGYRSFSSTVLFFVNPSTATSSYVTKNRTFYKTIGNHQFYY